MNDQLEIPIPPQPSHEPTLGELRFAVGFRQGAAVAALRKCDDASGEDNGADDLDACFLNTDKVQRDLLEYLRDWRARDEGHEDDEGDWTHPEGPLDDGERAMMNVFQTANDRLNELRMAIYALRARELAEMQDAGAVPSLSPTNPT